MYIIIRLAESVLHIFKIIKEYFQYSKKPQANFKLVLFIIRNLRLHRNSLILLGLNFY